MRIRIAPEGPVLREFFLPRATGTTRESVIPTGAARGLAVPFAQRKARGVVRDLLYAGALDVAVDFAFDFLSLNL
jgi:hypothetical protein